MTPNGTAAVAARSAPAAPGRIDWVDYAKGICIVMVVMMHSVLGVEAAAGQTGFMHVLVAFAKPFRMPDFFLISGLFLSVVIDREEQAGNQEEVRHPERFCERDQHMHEAGLAGRRLHAQHRMHHDHHDDADALGVVHPVDALGGLWHGGCAVWYHRCPLLALCAGIIGAIGFDWLIPFKEYAVLPRM